jgi:hypothetical protein
MAEIVRLITYFNNSKGGSNGPPLYFMLIHLIKKRRGLGAPSLLLYRCKTNLEVKTKYFTFFVFAVGGYNRIIISKLSH